MAWNVLRTSAKRFLSNFERNLAQSNLRSGKNNIYVCGCLSTSLVDNNIRFYATRRYSELTNPKTEEEYDSDSDTEVRIIKQAGESSFWRKKMRTFHSILDVNKDGVISFDDFQLLADRFINLGHISDERAKEFRELIKKIWDKQWGELGPYNPVTVEQYLEDMYHVVNDKTRAKKVHKFLPYLFEALDRDKTGEISLEEYKLFCECLGLSDEDAVFTFRVIDTNADGKVHMKEFVQLGKEFFLCEDEWKISKYFWGPLVN